MWKWKRELRNAQQKENYNVLTVAELGRIERCLRGFGQTTKL